jgi:hypothetical protein
VLVPRGNSIQKEILLYIPCYFIVGSLWNFLRGELIDIKIRNGGERGI